MTSSQRLRTTIDSVTIFNICTTSDQAWIPSQITIESWVLLQTRKRKRRQRNDFVEAFKGQVNEFKVCAQSKQVKEVLIQHAYQHADLTLQTSPPSFPRHRPNYIYPSNKIDWQPAEDIDGIFDAFHGFIVMGIIILETDVMGEDTCEEKLFTFLYNARAHHRAPKLSKMFNAEFSIQRNIDCSFEYLQTNLQQYEAVICDNNMTVDGMRYVHPADLDPDKSASKKLNRCLEKCPSNALLVQDRCVKHLKQCRLVEFYHGFVCYLYLQTDSESETSQSTTFGSCPLAPKEDVGDVEVQFDPEEEQVEVSKETFDVGLTLASLVNAAIGWQLIKDTFNEAKFGELNLPTDEQFESKTTQLGLENMGRPVAARAQVMNSQSIHLWGWSMLEMDENQMVLVYDDSFLRKGHCKELSLEYKARMQHCLTTLGVSATKRAAMVDALLEVGYTQAQAEEVALGMIDVVPTDTQQEREDKQHHWDVLIEGARERLLQRISVAIRFPTDVDFLDPTLIP
ncbi:hypothetical protein L7F22_000977 [Adiantum nelumboides]|nr:hypothetical protein [Adiantum nelumboides]